MKLRTFFDEKNKASTGGVTGSARVKGKSDNKFYQLKPSILDNSWDRRVKSKRTDRENFGEVIASYIGIGLLGRDEVPEVSLVYDSGSKKKRVLIASKYLEGDPEGVRDLDTYARKQGFNLKKKHVEIISGNQSNPEHGQIALGDEQMIDRKSLANSLVLSAIVGDHDVNPGNMIVKTRDGVTTISRIDFGHAFNDLLRAPPEFGGRLRHKNPIIDFFNREQVAGFPHGLPSKLWRDYPGVIPSEEMANALAELGSPDNEENVRQAILGVKEEFSLLIQDMRASQDTAGLKHVNESLAEIYKSFTGKKFIFSDKLSTDVDLIFQQLEIYICNNLRCALEVSDIMKLQVAIDNSLKNGDSIESVINNFDQQFVHSFSDALNFKTSVEWIKSHKDVPAFQGSLQDYVIQRHIELLKTPDYVNSSHASASSNIHNFIEQYTTRTFQKTNIGIYKNFAVKQGLQAVLVELNKDNLDNAALKAAELQSHLAEACGETKSFGRKSKAFQEVVKIQESLESIKSDRNSQNVAHHPMKTRVIESRHKVVNNSLGADDNDNKITMEV